MVTFSREEAEEDLREHRMFQVMSRGFEDGMHWMHVPALLQAKSDEELLAAAKEMREAFLESGKDIPELPGMIVQVGPFFHVIVNRAQMNAAVAAMSGMESAGAGELQAEEAIAHPSQAHSTANVAPIS